MQEYWCGLPWPPPGDLPNPGIEPRCPTLQADSLLSEPPGKPSIDMKCPLKRKECWERNAGVSCDLSPGQLASAWAAPTSLHARPGFPWPIPLPWPSGSEDGRLGSSRQRPCGSVFSSLISTWPFELPGSPWHYRDEDSPGTQHSEDSPSQAKHTAPALLEPPLLGASTVIGWHAGSFLCCRFCCAFVS